MLQTAYGSLTIGLDAKPGQTLLIRGGTSSVGLTAAILAKRQGLTVLSTTRSPEKAERLRDIGVDHVIIDDGPVAPTVRNIASEGVDLALELVGAPTLHDTLRTLRVHGVACFTGMLSNSWVVEDFYPIAYIPTGVRLTAYSGEAADLPTQVLQDYLDAVADDHRLVPVDRVYPLEEIAAAHDRMERNRAAGKIVVLP
jgi:NADPH:quinone reductase-like Zn-dependent oxidoreductase